ncbi:MAG: tetratricopeptide repeat protein [Acidobacteriota bacterium]
MKGTQLTCTLTLLLSAIALGVGADQALSELEISSLLQESEQLSQEASGLATPPPHVVQAGAVPQQRDLPAGEAARRANDRVASLYHQGRIEEALSLGQRVLVETERKLGADHPQTATSLGNLGAVLISDGQLDRALPRLERALAIYERQLGSDHPWTVVSARNLGVLLVSLGELERAETLLEVALAAHEREHPPPLAEKAICHLHLGAVAEARGELDTAGDRLERALKLAEQAYGTRHPEVATAHNRLGRLRQKTQDLAAARKHLEAAISIRRESLGDHRHTAAALLHLGRLEELEGSYAAARAVYEQALAVYRRAEGFDSVDATYALDPLGSLHVTVGDLAAARHYLESSLAIRQRALGPQHSETGASHNSFGTVLFALGDYQAARSHFEKAVEIAEASDPDSPDLVGLLVNTSSALRQTGETTRAEHLLARCLATSEKAFGEGHPQTAYCLHELGALSHQRGNPDAARDALERALEIRERALGPSHPEVAQTLNELGRVISAQGDLDAAVGLFERVLGILEERFGKDSRHVGAARLNLGTTLWTLGELQPAKLHVEQGLESLEAALGEEHIEVASAYQIMGRVSSSLGGYEVAREYLRRSVAITESIYGPDSLEITGSLVSLSSVLTDCGDVPYARELLDRVLTIRRRELPPDDPGIAHALLKLGGLLREVGDLELAKAHFEEALQIWTKTLGADHLWTATAVHYLAGIRQSQGDLVAAQELFERANEVFERALGPANPIYAGSLSCLAAAVGDLGDTTRAVELQAQALAIKEHSARRLYATGHERERLRIAHDLDALGVNHAVNLSVRLDAPSSEAARLALTAVLRHKGRVLDSILESRRRLRADTSPETLELVERLKSLDEFQSVISLHRLDGVSDAERLVCHRETNQARRETVDELTRRSAFEAPQPPVTLEAVQAEIPEASALVELIHYHHWSGGELEAHYAIAVLRSSGAPKWLDLGPAAAIDDLAIAFRRVVSRPGKPFREAAQALYRRTLGKIDALVGDAEELILSLDSVLLLVPFAALVDEDGQFVIERFRLRHITSGRDLLPRPPLDRQRQPALVVGGPAFDMLPLTAAEGSSEPLATRANEPSTLHSQIPSTQRFSSLAGTVAEARTVGQLLKLASDRILTGTAATEASVKAVRSPWILHLATHGFFGSGRSAAGMSEDFDPLLRSGLALAGVNRREEVAGADEGLLTGLEVASLDLEGTEIVVLSACDTGVGELYSGEGVFGLRRALVLAGARTRVMSLWKVADKPTRDLMIDWYQQLLSGTGRAEALRRVQLAAAGRESSAEPADPEADAASAPETRGVEILVRDSRRQHPYYWAAFFVAGQGGPL